MIPTFELGGAEKQLLAVVTLMAKDQSVLVMGQKKGALLGQYRTSGAKIVALPPLPILSHIVSTAFLLVLTLWPRKTILEAFLPASIIVGAFVKLLRPSKVFLLGNRRSHLFYRKGRKILTLLDKWGTSKCDLLICNSRSVVSETLDLDRIDGSRVVVIPNGIECTAIFSEHQLTVSPKVFHVSNHHTYKRTSTLLEAIRTSTVLSRVPIHFFGEGEETIQLREFVIDFDLRTVIFHGHVLNPWSGADYGDIYVHTSETEGFSNSILEAMNLGMALILTDIPANRDVAHDCALYFPVGDYDELRVLLERLVEDYEFRRSLVESAQERVRNKFDLKVVVRERKLLHQSLTERGPSDSSSNS